MALPRVFISSTFYDLKQTRADVERFIKDLGYEPILNERGSIPYGQHERLEEYCYKEIESIDILVAIIGGKFGSSSQHEPYSISQMEINTALERGKQVYIFVEASVLYEYQTYLANRGNESIKYRYVDDPRVYEFLEGIHALSNNNPIAPFHTSEDINTYLGQQWAGLFQRLLQEQAKKNEFKVIKDLQTTAVTLQQLVNFLTEEKKADNDAIKHILSVNHPLFAQLKELLSVAYRVYFISYREMEEWLSARNFEDDPFHDDDDAYHFMKSNTKRIVRLDIDRSIFDENGNLKIFTASDWNSAWVRLSYENIAVPPPKIKHRESVGALSNQPIDYDDADPFVSD